MRGNGAMFHTSSDNRKQHEGSKKGFLVSLFTLVNFLIVGNLMILASCSSDGQPPPSPTQIITARPATTASPIQTVSPQPTAWEQKVSGIRWVAYSSPSSDPNKNIEASVEAIREDLAV